MEFYLIKLHFLSPLHISKGSEDYASSEDFLHSDTLKSALFVCYSQLFENTSHTFFDQFKLSSAFPFYKENYFFPRPFISLPIEIKEQSTSQIKKLKKIQWLEKSLFEKCIHNERIEVSLENFSKNGKFLSLNFNTDHKPFLYLTNEQSRVKINYGQDAEPFYFERIYFQDNAGLYVLVECSQDFLYSTLLPAFKLLGENGLGSYKSIGNGQFEPYLESKKITLRVPTASEHILNLSLYCPSSEDIQNRMETKNTFYQLIKRGGYITHAHNPNKTTWRKKTVYMFQEGSIFHAKYLEGKVADLAPENFEHSIYREGRPVFIPVIISQSSE